MLVGPMRSKFVDASSPELHGDDVDQWTYVTDPGLCERFPLWLPALADVLMDIFGGATSAFSALPEGMREWRHGVAAAGNPVAEWCDAALRVTGNARDYVVVGEVMGGYGGNLTRARFAQLVAAQYAGVPGVRYKQRTTVTRADGTRDVVSCVLWGVVEMIHP
jgi:hypothetical protein